MTKWLDRWRYVDWRRFAWVFLGIGVASAAFFATLALPAVLAAGLAFTAVLATWVGLMRLTGRAHDQRSRQLETIRSLGDGRGIHAIYDPETGFCQDWYFKLRLQEEVLRSSRYGQPFALLLVEPVRPLGSKVRSRLHHCMETACRRSDLVGVLGESRFCILLTVTDASGAIATRHRLLTEVRRGNVRIGIGCYPQDGREWKDLLLAAGATPQDFYPVIGMDWDPEGSSAFDLHESEAA